MNQIQQCCVWTPDHEFIFETQCGHSFVFDSGGVKDNGFKFCPYCAKPIDAPSREEGGSNG